MRATRLALVLLLVPILGGCGVAAPQQPAPEPAACQDPVYLELSTTHPDSLSDRAWDRLQELAAQCRAERAGETRLTVSDPATDHHLGAWLWMPAMMVVGGMMWLMMGPH